MWNNGQNGRSASRGHNAKSRGSYSPGQPGRPGRGNTEQSSEFTLFIDGINNTTFDNELALLFSKLGPVCRTFISRQTKNPRYEDTTYGFIAYKRENDARQAILQLNGETFKGHILKVSWSRRPLSKSITVEDKVKPKREDDDKDKYLHKFLDTYTLLKSQEAEGKYRMPELGELLNDIRQCSHKMAAQYLDDDYDLNFSLPDLEYTFIENVGNNMGMSALRSGDSFSVGNDMGMSALRSGDSLEDCTEYTMENGDCSAPDSNNILVPVTQQSSPRSTTNTSPRPTTNTSPRPTTNTTDTIPSPGCGRGRGAIMAALGLSPNVGHEQSLL